MQVVAVFAQLLLNAQLTTHKPAEVCGGQRPPAQPRALAIGSVRVRVRVCDKHARRSPEGVTAPQQAERFPVVVWG